MLLRLLLSFIVPPFTKLVSSQEVGKICGRYKQGVGASHSMAKEYTNGFYATRAWKECRKAYLKSVSGLCEDCLAKGIYTPAKVVHHKTWISPDNINDASITLNWDNLKAVCQDCHAKEHAADKRFSFDEEGNVIAM